MDDKKELTKRSFSSALWILSSSGVKIILQFILTIILARLLTPADFGLIGTAFIIVRFVEVSPIEITSALVQLPNLETRHLRTGFTMTILLGLLITIIIVICAPLLGNFFNTKELPSILYAIALTFPLAAAADVAEALLQRELKFKILSSIQVLAHAIGYGVVGITMAVTNFGVWSLVGAYIGQISTRTILLLIVQPHTKLPQLEKKAVKELIHLGGGFSISNLFNYLALQGDYIVVGKWLGQEALGLYTRAYNLMALPTNTLGHAMSKVLFPAMAKVQEDRDRLKRAYRRNLVITALIALPISLIVYILAPEIILVLLGEKWTQVIMPLQILAIGTFFRFGHKVSGILARSSGQVYHVARIQFCYALLVVVGASIGLKYGIEGVAFGVTVALVIQYLLLSQLGMTITNMSYREFLASHVVALPISVACLSMLLLTTITMRMWHFPAYLILSLSTCLTIGLMIGLIFYAPSIFLGEDGTWLLNNLFKSSICKKLAKVWKR